MDTELLDRALAEEPAKVTGRRADTGTKCRISLQRQLSEIRSCG